MPKKQPDPVMTIDDLAEYLKLSKSSVYKLCQAGKIPGQKVGRHWRFHRDVIDTWLKAGERTERT
jgi:excisionase family DNA binding protein